MEQLRDVRDEGHVKVRASNIRYRGYILDLVTDDLTLASTGGHMMREYIKHDDAVAVVPVREGEGGTEILLIRQYRHPTRSVLWEIPAGLLDKPGEDTLQAAERELAELGETLETPAPRKTKKKKAAPAPAPAPVVESETVVLTSDAIVEP